MMTGLGFHSQEQSKHYFDIIHELQVRDLIIVFDNRADAPMESHQHTTGVQSHTRSLTVCALLLIGPVQVMEASLW